MHLYVYETENYFLTSIDSFREFSSEACKESEHSRSLRW